MSISILIGEFFNKITILEINKERIHEAAKLVNINKVPDALNGLMKKLSFSRADIQKEFDEFNAINTGFWIIGDDIRDKESAKEVDDAFIELASSVCFTNEKCSDVKMEISLKPCPDFIEEKSYEDYAWSLPVKRSLICSLA